ncbi:MAG TPA: hypothetical protein VEY70_04225 [Metabacillus sp.]|nr:hypothetical protein [Metabacillus sp.]
MWSIVGILLIGLIVFIIDVKPLIKGKNYREISIYSSLLLSGLALSSLLILKVRIPTPLDFITAIYRPFISFIERLLS